MPGADGLPGREGKRGKRGTDGTPGPPGERVRSEPTHRAADVKQTERNWD